MAILIANLKHIEKDIFKSKLYYHSKQYIKPGNKVEWVRNTAWVSFCFVFWTKPALRLFFSWIQITNNVVPLLVVNVIYRKTPFYAGVT